LFPLSHRIASLYQARAALNRWP